MKEQPQQANVIKGEKVNSDFKAKRHQLNGISHTWSKDQWEVSLSCGQEPVLLRRPAEFHWPRSPLRSRDPGFSPCASPSSFLTVFSLGFCCT